MDDMQDLNWLASEIDSINDINELNKIIQTSQGIPALLANDRKTKLMKFQQQAQGAQALAQGQKPPVMAQIKGQAAQQDAARQAQMMQLAQLAALQQPQDEGLAALPYDEEEGESPEYQGTENESAEEGEGAAMGGLVALAQGGSVDGPKKDFADKTVDNLTGLLHDWYDNSVFSMAQGGPVRGFYEGSQGDPLKPMGPASNAGFYQPESDYMPLWPVAEEAASAGPGNAFDYAADKVSGAYHKVRDAMRAGDQRAGEIFSYLSGGPSPTSKSTDLMNALGLHQVDNAKLGRRIDFSTGEITPPVKSENERAAETQDTSNQTTASGTTTELPSEFQVEKTADNLKTKQPDTLKFTSPDQGGLRALGPQPKSTPSAPPAAPANKVSSQAPATPSPTTPPAGGQTTTPPGGQEQGQQRLTNELEQHPHQEEIINTIDNPKLSWQDKVKYLQEVIGAPYQMSPELLSKYEKQLADMRSEKGWMTGLSFLTGVLGARTPWLSQALSEGGIQALGTYGKYAGDESKLEQGLLEQQMGIEKAPVEARQKAGLELLKQQSESQKQAADLRKSALLGGLRYQGATDSAYIRNRGVRDKAAYDRTTRLLVEHFKNSNPKPMTPADAEKLAATNAPGANPRWMQLTPQEQRDFRNDMARDIFAHSQTLQSGAGMDRIGGAGQQQIFNLQ